MPENKFIAAAPLKFGARLIQPGEAVPIEPGRSYHQMLALGQIAHAPARGQAPSALTPQSRAVFVDAEGDAVWVTYQGAEDPDDEAREALDLESGEQAALVLFEGGAESMLVPLGSLISDSAPVDTLMARLTQMAQALERLSEELQKSGAEIEWTTLLLKAVAAEGKPLPEGEVGVKELLSHGVRTREGARLLGDNLTRLRGIGKPTAEKIQAWLSAERS